MTTPETNPTGATVRLGRFSIRYADRQVGDDGGPALHVYGPCGDKEEEVLRFDCFAREPHYHLGWSYRDEPFHRITAADPFAWALTELRRDANRYLEAAEAEPMNAAELELLPDALAKLEEARGEARRNKRRS